MQVTQTVSEGLKREYKVVIAAADMTSRIEARLDELRRTIRLKGFRPGKVPVDLLRRQFGKNIVGEVVQQTLRDSSSDAVAQQGVRPATQPSIEDMSFDEGEDLEYVLAVEVMPEIETGDFSSYELENLVIEVSEDDVDRGLQRLREHSRTFTGADAGHEAGEGDAVVIDFTGKVDGADFAGGSGEGRTVEIGAGRLLPDLEQSLKGRKAGESFSVDVSFPDDYGPAHLAGKTAVFEVKVKEIRLVEMPVLDDAFAERQGVESFEALRAGMGERLGAEYGQLARGRLKRGLLDKLADAYGFEVPSGLVDREFDAIWAQVERGRQHRREADGGESPDGGEDDEAKREYRAIAERRVRLALLLGEVARARNIEISSEEVQDAVAQRIRQFPGQEARVARHYRENPHAIRELTAPLLEDRVVDDILTQVKLVERKVTLEEFFAIEKAEEGGGPAAAPAGDDAAPPDGDGA